MLMPHVLVLKRFPAVSYGEPQGAMQRRLLEENDRSELRAYCPAILNWWGMYKHEACAYARMSQWSLLANQLVDKMFVSSVENQR
jgi:hypothetical protein